MNDLGLYVCEIWGCMDVGCRDEFGFVWIGAVDEFLAIFIFFDLTYRCWFSITNRHL